MSSSPDHVYLDLFAINNDTTGSNIKSVLQFTETRTNNILDNPSNYFLTVARFEADTPAVSLPIFIPALAIDGINTNINRTCYTVTMAAPSGGLLTNVHSVNVIWVPEDQTASLPANRFTTGISGFPVLGSQDITTGYYSCYNVKWWLSCVNKALSDCWVAVSGLDASTAPLLVSDAGTNQITLLTPISPVLPINFAQSEYSVTSVLNDPTYLGIGSSPAVNCCMFFNEPLFNLFSGFPSVYYGNSLTSASFDAPSNVTIGNKFWLFNYYVLPINFQNKNYITLNPVVGTPSSWIVTGSEYSPVPMWNPIASLVFTSSLLPITMSFTSIPQVSNSSSYDITFTNTGNNAQISNMLSDIQVGLVTGSEYKPSVLYVPGAEYRLIDMLGNNPIFQASFGVSWKTKFGQIVPFRLGSQCGANIKILFRRKRFNLGNLPPYDTN
jgi:hypothetical protein